MENKITVTIFLISFLSSISIAAQEKFRFLEGSVSYIANENIYVKFENTDGIENGDTLYIFKTEKYIPALVVEHHSSISALSKTVGDLTFIVSDKIFAKIKDQGKKEIMEPVLEVEHDVSEQALISSTKIKEKKGLDQDISGRISVSSYSNFSNTLSDDTHRFRYTFSMDAEHISDSKLSAETYISFTHKLNQWDLVKADLNSALKIYSLALKYDINESTSVYGGRKINTRIANIGAIDGLQFLKQFNNLYAGAVIGFRPDYKNYGFNPNLLEYGGYIGQNNTVKNGFVQTSLALFEQRNNGNTDRRFAYFQHSNSAIKNLNIFASFELDLYKLENGQPKSTIDLTGLYFSLRYRFSRRFSVFGSYDSRKNVIYYETFKSYATNVLQLASRQGLRVRINTRPFKYLMFGVNAGTRFQKNDPRSTNTLNGFATYTKVPGLNASLSLNANLMQTSYLDGQIFGARLSKDIIAGKLYSQLSYRHVNFNYVNFNSQLKQHIGAIDLSYQFNKKLYFSVNVETTFQKKENYNRVYLNLRRKF